MNRTHLPAGSLTSLEAARAALLDGLEPVAPNLVPLDQALGRVAAGMPPIANPLPSRSIATVDGWACRALELVGASPYSPLVLGSAPTWLETGDEMPEGCDCVLERGLIEGSGALIQVLGEAAPGQGVRRAGEDLTAGSPLVLEGRRISAADLLVARMMGKDELAVRAPKVRLIDVGSISGEAFTRLLIADRVQAWGTVLAEVVTSGRYAASILAALDGEPCDLVLLIGGTGDGRADATAEALATGGMLLAHRIAMRPGMSTAIGGLGATPIAALPGLPDQALAAFLVLVQPLLDRLTGFSQESAITLPLARKIASTVGLCEVALLRQEHGVWTPLAVGEFSLDAMRRADAWLAVPGGSEGYAAGTPVAAVPLRISS